MRDLNKEFKDINECVNDIDTVIEESKDVIDKTLLTEGNMASQIKDVIASLKDMGKESDKEKILGEFDTVLVHLSFILRDLKETGLMNKLRKCRESMDIYIEENK